MKVVSSFCWPVDIEAACFLFSLFDLGYILLSLATRLLCAFNSLYKLAVCCFRCCMSLSPNDYIPLLLFVPASLFSPALCIGRSPFAFVYHKSCKPVLSCFSSLACFHLDYRPSRCLNSFVCRCCYACPTCSRCCGAFNLLLKAFAEALAVAGRTRYWNKRDCFPHTERY